MITANVLILLLGLVGFVAADGQPSGNACLTWGDPHIWTWDGNLYSTQGIGYYHMVVSDNINVQARFDHGCNGPSVTCIFSFTVFIVDDSGDTHSFALLSDFNQNPTPYRRPFDGSPFAYMTYIDGADAHMVPAVNGGDPYLSNAGVPQIVGNGGKVTYYTDNNIYSVNFVFHNIVVQYTQWTLTVSPIGIQSNELWSNVCGLCGTFDGQQNDDFQARDETVYTYNGANSERFATTWNVTDADAKYGFFSCKNGPEPTPAPSRGPTPTPAAPTPFPTRPPTAVPTSPPSTVAPTPGPTPTPAGPTTAPTPQPTTPATQSPTPRPTNPVTQGPTPTPASTPTPAPTPFVTTGSVTTGSSTTGGGGGGGNQTTNTTIIVNSFNGTTAFTNANATCCANAQVCPGDPLYESCMMDVLLTNETTLAVSAAGAIVLAGCAKTNITDSSCTQGSLFACPSACSGAGSCIQGQCHCNKGYKADSIQGCVAAGLTQAEIIAVGVSAGVVAAIVIGAIVFLALAGFGAKKGYDYYHMKDNKMANVNSNPLYNEKKTGGVSPLYADKA